MTFLLVLFFIPSLTEAKSSVYKEASWKTLSLLDLKTRKPTSELKEYLEKKISIKGFMIPLEYSDQDLSEFLLVPYVPSCMHVPPPPENQIIHVKLSNFKQKASWYPILVKGKLTLAKIKTTKVKKEKDEFEETLPEAFFEIIADKITEEK